MSLRIKLIVPSVSQPKEWHFVLGSSKRSTEQLLYNVNFVKVALHLTYIGTQNFGVRQAVAGLPFEPYQAGI
jgi:hypothetical protein